MIAKLIGGLVTLIIGITLLPEISNQMPKLIGWQIESKEKPHRQTYLEYVNERLEAQRLIHNQ